MTTIDDFMRWNGPAVTGTGTVVIDGVLYTIITGPAGRFLASGPAAYLFDEQGVFIDWTADRGDLRTRIHGFDLRGGYQPAVTE